MSKEQIAFWIAGENARGSGGSSAVVGQIMSFVGNKAPPNWAICDGTLVSVSSYPDLFLLIGVEYGGDGVTSFALPDLRSRAPVGAGAVGFKLNSVGGSDTITLLKDNLPNVTLNVSGVTSASKTSITATSTDAGHTHNVTALPSRSFDGSNTGTQWIPNMETAITSTNGFANITTDINDPTHDHAFSASTEALGSATSITIQTPYVAVNYIIYTGV
jgi:microcystin-dependent protein